MGVRHFGSVGDFSTVGARERGRGKLGFLRSRRLVHHARHLGSDIYCEREYGSHTGNIGVLIAGGNQIEDLDDAGWPESFCRPSLVPVFKLVR
jgi:hypothetical protein